jgi:hypothetical protein
VWVRALSPTRHRNRPRVVCSLPPWPPHFSSLCGCVLAKLTRRTLVLQVDACSVWASSLCAFSDRTFGPSDSATLSQHLCEVACLAADAAIRIMLPPAAAPFTAELRLSSNVVATWLDVAAHVAHLGAIACNTTRAAASRGGAWACMVPHLLGEGMLLRWLGGMYALPMSPSCVVAAALLNLASSWLPLVKCISGYRAWAGTASVYQPAGGLP